jgi:hypothetical protein
MDPFRAESRSSSRREEKHATVAQPREPHLSRVSPPQPSQRVSPPRQPGASSSQQQRRPGRSLQQQQQRLAAPSSQGASPSSSGQGHVRFCNCRGCAPDLYEESGWPSVTRDSRSHFAQFSAQFSCVVGCCCCFCQMTNDPKKLSQGGDCLHDGHKLAVRYRCRSPRCLCHLGCGDSRCRICNRIQ